MEAAKCELIANDVSVIQRFQTVAPDIIIFDPATTVLLGAPIGGQQSVDRVLENKLGELKRLSDRLKQLRSHDAFSLLRTCFSLPKLQYTMRCSSYFDSSVIARYDKGICDTLDDVFHVQLSEYTWLQASLPVNVGRLGVRKKNWDMPLVAAASAVLLATAPNQAAVACLKSVPAPQAGALLHAISKTAIGTRMSDHCLRIAVAIRLGTSVCVEHRCLCGAMVDVVGIRGLTCRISNGRWHVTMPSMNSSNVHC
jgi:hypothetical protein